MSTSPAQSTSDPSRFVPTGRDREFAQLGCALERASGGAGGVVALNGYGSPPWLGETAAFEAYFKEIGQPLPHVRKLSYSIRPGGYFIKE